MLKISLNYTTLTAHQMLKEKCGVIGLPLKKINYSLQMTGNKLMIQEF